MLKSKSYQALFFFFALFIFTIPTMAAVQCLNQSGKAVDWWLIYKLPERTTPNKTLGYSYFYIDADISNKGGSPIFYADDSKQSLNTTNHALYYTLEQIYAGKSDTKNVGWFMYNDSPPAGAKSDCYGKSSDPYPKQCAHMKGALAFDGESGFWLPNSIPDFPPPAKSGYSYSGSYLNGQDALCVSLQSPKNSDQFNTIGEQLKFSNAEWYDYNLPAAYAANLTAFNDIINKQGIKIAPGEQIKNLVTKSSMPLISVVEANTFPEDNQIPFYQYLANSSLKSDLSVQTWLNSCTPLGALCDDTYKVAQVQTLKAEEQGFAWNTNTDHSKWAIGAVDYVCFGDVNHTKEAEMRGGGAVCFQNKIVHSFLSKMMDQVTSCKKDEDGFCLSETETVKNDDNDGMFLILQ